MQVYNHLCFWLKAALAEALIDKNESLFVKNKPLCWWFGFLQRNPYGQRACHGQMFSAHPFDAFEAVRRQMNHIPSKDRQFRRSACRRVCFFSLPFESPVFWQHIEIPLRWAGLPPAGEKEADNCCVRRRCASFGSYSDDWNLCWSGRDTGCNSTAGIA